MSKYGLNLRPAQQKKQPPQPPLATPFGFNDDDEDDVEREIARQASKSKALKEIEERQKKALEEDPTVFDYDGVYDDMKVKEARPVMRDREERKPKYIMELMKKAKERERYREIVYEKKIAKERMKDDHLYADKDKFITSSYRKKLAEREKELEMERLRELREEREDVTKKKDFLVDFYSNLDKNVAYGAREAERRKPDKQASSGIPDRHVNVNINALEEGRSLNDIISPLKPPCLKERHECADGSDGKEQPLKDLSSPLLPTNPKYGDEGENSSPSDRSLKQPDGKLTTESSEQDKTSNKQLSASQPQPDHHKRTQDAVAEAKERFLARKRAKEQQSLMDIL